MKARQTGKVSSRHFRDVVIKVAEAIECADPVSALRGLEITAAAFAAVLDVYAKPNPNNAAGMCDDPQAFRAHFAAIITNAPSLPDTVLFKGLVKL